MAIAFVSTTALTPTSGTSQTYSSINNTSGNLAFISFVLQGSGSTDPITAVTYGGISGSYVNFVNRFAGADRTSGVWVIPNIPTGSNSLVITLSSSKTFDQLSITFYSGCDTTSPIDVSYATNTGSSPITVNGTSSSANNWIFGICGDSSGGGYSSYTTSGTGAGTGTMRRSVQQNMIGDSNGAIGAGAFSTTTTSGNGNMRIITVSFKEQAAATSQIKTWDGVTQANVKNFLGATNAQTKTWDGVTNV